MTACTEAVTRVALLRQLHDDPVLGGQALRDADAFIRRLILKSEAPMVVLLGVVAYLGICQYGLCFHNARLARERLFTGLLMISFEVSGAIAGQGSHFTDNAQGHFKDQRGI